MQSVFFPDHSPRVSTAPRLRDFDFDANSFTDGTVQALYEAYKADPTDETKKALSTAYLTTHYPTVVRRK